MYVITNKTIDTTKYGVGGGPGGQPELQGYKQV